MIGTFSRWRVGVFEYLGGEQVWVEVGWGVYCRDKTRA